MPAETTPIGSISISGVSGGEIKLDGITVDVKAGGDIVGRDKVVNQITHLVQALSLVEEADKAQTIAARRLAEGVRDYVQRLRAVAAADTNAAKGGPYRGLLAYRLGDAALFFGRNGATADLRQHLERGRLTILQAESGAGKSSLLQAGLAPCLLADGHLPVYLRPYNQSPSQVIKRAFLPHLSQSAAEISETSRVYAELAAAPLRDFLRQVTAVLGPAASLCLLLDQFEEYFTLLPEADRAAFVVDLADCLEDESLNARWVLALRSEFFGDLAHFRPRIRNPFENDYRLDRLRPVEAMAAIIAPAHRQGVEYEPILLEALLADMRGDGGEVAPPQLQLVCSALYDLLRESQTDNPALPPVLTLAMYEQSGRVQGILGGHLHRILTKTLTVGERDLARRLLVALVSSDQRRLRRTRSDLAAELATYLLAGQSLNDLLERLVVEGRLLRVDEDEHTGEPAYELAHDYLLAEIQVSPEEQARKAAQELLKQEVIAYRRFKTLLDVDKFNIIHGQREFLVLDETASELLERSQAAIEAEVREKEAQRQRELAQAQRLAEEALARQEAEAQRAQEAEARAREQTRAARRIRRFALGLAVLLLATVGVGIFATMQWYQVGVEKENVSRQRDEAEQQARRAQSGQLAAQVQASLAKEDGRADSLALLLAREAVLTTLGPDHRFTPEADATLRQAVAGAPPWQMTLPQHRHTAPVLSVKFSPDGRMIATASEDQTARLWDANTGAEIRRFTGHKGDVLAVAFSPATSANAGQTIVTGGADRTARLWDTNTGVETQRFTGHTDWIRAVAFSPDGKTIATASDDGTARLWEVATGQEIRRFEGHTDFVLAVTFSPDGQTVATAGRDHTVRLWNVTTGQEKLRFSGHTEAVYGLAFSPDGQTVATGSADKTIIVWSAKTGEEIRRFDGDMGFIFGIALSPDGQMIAAASTDEKRASPYLYLWEVNTGREIHHFAGHTDIVLAAAFSPDGQTVATSSQDGTIRLWDAIKKEERPLFPGHTAGVTAVDVSADGKTVVTGGEDKTARLWDITTGEEKHLLLGHTGTIAAVAASPTGKLIVTASADQTARLWDMTTGKEIRQFKGHAGPVNDVAFKPDGQMIATASADQTARLWQVTTGQEIRRFEGHTGPVNALAFSPDGKMIATASADQTARLWQVTTGQEIRRFEGRTGPVNAIAFSPDGKMIVTASADHTARCWNVATGQEIRQFAGHTGPVTGVAFSLDGQIMGTASTDSTARLWNVTTGQEINRLAGHTGAVTAIAFSPDRQTVVTSGADRTTRLWQMNKPGTDSFQGHTQPIRWVAFSRDGTRLVTAGYDGTARLWNAATGAEIHRFEGHGDYVHSAAFSPDGQMIVTVSAGAAHLWDTRSGDELKQLGHWVLAAAFSPDGETVATTGEDKNTCLWHLATGKQHCWQGHTNKVLSAAFSPDGQTLVTTSADETIRFWDATTGVEVHAPLQAASNSAGNWVWSVAFSADGQTLLTAHDDGAARLWDVAKGQEIKRLGKHNSAMLSAAFQPNGQLVVTTGADGTTRLWDVATGQELRQFREATDEVWSAAFNPDGRTVAAAGSLTPQLRAASIEDLLEQARVLIQREPPLLTLEEQHLYGFDETK